MSRNILVTGKNGQLGRSLKKAVNLFYNSPHQSPNNFEIIKDLNFIFVARDELDLSNPQSIILPYYYAHSFLFSKTFSNLYLSVSFYPYRFYRIDNYIIVLLYFLKNLTNQSWCYIVFLIW